MYLTHVTDTHTGAIGPVALIVGQFIGRIGGIPHGAGVLSILDRFGIALEIPQAAGTETLHTDQQGHANGMLFPEVWSVNTNSTYLLNFVNIIIFYSFFIFMDKSVNLGNKFIFQTNAYR